MFEIVLASSNPGKIKEFQAICEPFNVKLIPQAELGIEDVEETGTTFVENALIKARHAAKLSGMPAVADDSGLVVDALGGMPGVRSARYAGEGADDAARVRKLLNELRKVKLPDRDAFFHCVTVLLEDENDPAPLICEGVWEGKIIFEPKGDNGFGYDPVFYVPDQNCTAAELSAEIKNKISHRADALEQLTAALEQITE